MRGYCPSKHHYVHSPVSSKRTGSQAYGFDFANYNDNWGVGLRLAHPQLGPAPLRMDHAFPITHGTDISRAG